MAVWSVDIVAGANPGDPATFVARNQPAAPVGIIYADAGDIVSWNNATAEDHQPVQDPLEPPVGTVTGPVVTPGHQTSGYVVTGNPGMTVSYTCLLHSSEKGKILITPIPAPTV
jgi:plastocyanin